MMQRGAGLRGQPFEPDHRDVAGRPGGPRRRVQQRRNPVRAQHGHTDDAVQALDVHRLQVIRGDQRRMVVVGQPDRFAGLQHQPAQTGAAPDPQPAVVIRTDSLMHRHRELSARVAHRRGGDVHAR